MKIQSYNESQNDELLRCRACILQIKKILENSSYDDITCFQKIEAILEEYEKAGIQVSFRHDF